MASLLDFVSQTRGIVFYSSVASFGQHFTCDLCSLDVAVYWPRASVTRTIYETHMGHYCDI